MLDLAIDVASTALLLLAFLAHIIWRMCNAGTESRVMRAGRNLMGLGFLIFGAWRVSLFAQHGHLPISWWSLLGSDAVALGYITIAVERIGPRFVERMLQPWQGRAP